MRRLKPTEVRAVADMLEEPASDTVELARMILRKVNEMRDREQLWVAIATRENREARVYGPYLTLNEARANVEVVRVGWGDAPGLKVGFWRLEGRDMEEE